MFSLLALMAISLHHCPSRSVQKTYLFFFFSDLGFPKNSNLFCFFFIFWFLLFSFYFYFLWSYINRVFESTDPIFAVTWRQMISVVKYLRIYFDCQSMSMKFLTTPNSGIDHINLWFFIYFAMLLHVAHSPSLSTSLILSLTLSLSLSLTHTHTHTHTHMHVQIHMQTHWDARAHTQLPTLNSIIHTTWIVAEIFHTFVHLIMIQVTKLTVLFGTILL